MILGLFLFYSQQYCYIEIIFICVYYSSQIVCNKASFLINFIKLMKNFFSQAFFYLVFLVLATACSGSNNSQSKLPEVEEGIDIQKNPLGAIQKAVELGKNAGNINQEIGNKKPVKPVSFKELIKYLPKAPKNWKTEKPMGETTSISKYSISQVSQAYRQEDKEISISIFDWAFNAALYTPFLLTTEFSQESTEGYNKGIKIDDIPGREEYTYSSKKGSLNLLVDGRFFVQIDGKNIEEQELREWWQLIDQKSLGKISKKSVDK